MTGETQRLLLASLRQPVVPGELIAAAAALDESGWRRFVALAAEQRVRPLVRATLTAHAREVRIPPEATEALDRQCRRIASRLIARHAELGGILKDLHAAGIASIVLKGGCLAHVAYRDLALREMNDLDVLVHREELSRAVAVLVARGYAPTRQVDVSVDAAARHHVSPMVKGTVSVEVHWNITLPGQPHSIDPADLWRRAETMTIAGVDARRLGLVDLLLHVCVHASYQHRFQGGLRPFCDLAAIVETCGARLNWSLVCELAEVRRWARGVFATLILARDLVGAQIPDAVLDRLRTDGADNAVVNARRLIWTTPDELAQFEPNLSALASHSTWPARLGAGLRHVFPPTSELAYVYAIPPGSPWLPTYYARRVWDVTRRHGRSALRLLVGSDRRLQDLAACRDRVREWLEH